MAYGHYEGKEISDSELRTYFTRDYVIQSDWYKERLKLKQVREVKFLQQQLASLEAFNSNPKNSELVKEMDIAGRIASVKMDQRAAAQGCQCPALRGLGKPERCVEL